MPDKPPERIWANMLSRSFLSKPPAHPLTPWLEYILASRVAAEKETLEKEIERLREALGIIAAKKYDVWAFGECKSIAINTLGELEATRTADIKEKQDD